MFVRSTPTLSCLANSTKFIQSSDVVALRGHLESYQHVFPGPPKIAHEHIPACPVSDLLENLTETFSARRRCRRC